MGKIAKPPKWVTATCRPTTSVFWLPAKPTPIRSAWEKPARHSKPCPAATMAKWIPVTPSTAHRVERVLPGVFPECAPASDRGKQADQLSQNHWQNYQQPQLAHHIYHQAVHEDCPSSCPLEPNRSHEKARQVGDNAYQHGTTTLPPARRVQTAAEARLLGVVATTRSPIPSSSCKSGTRHQAKRGNRPYVILAANKTGQGRLIELAIF